MINAISANEPSKDLRFLVVKFGWDQQQNGVADHLVRLVPKDPGRSGVPTLDGAIERLANDGIVGRLDDRGQPGVRLAGATIPGCVSHAVHRILGYGHCSFRLGTSNLHHKKEVGQESEGRAKQAAPTASSVNTPSV
jgi:hypothetical protein